MGSDNAGNGRRGVRAALSPALLAVLSERYGLDRVDSVRDLGGSSSLNLSLACGTERSVVRVYRPYVDAARLDAIQRVRRVLRQGGVPCAELVPTRDGASWVRLDDRLVEVERFVESDSKMDSWERLERGLSWLGRIHALLQGVVVEPDGRQPLFANHIEPFDALAGTLRGTERARRWNPTPEGVRRIAAAEELAHRVTDAERDHVASLKRQLVHGDFWDNNVFFRDGQVALVTDLDFMGERARSDDLALTLYFASMDFAPEPDRVRRLVDAYDRGLETPLSPLERAAIPLAMARQPLWWIGRWLPLLDDEDEAREGFAGMAPDVAWALRLLDDTPRWQRAFAR